MTRRRAFLAVFSLFAAAAFIGALAGIHPAICAGLLLVFGGVAWIITDEVFVQ